MAIIIDADEHKPENLARSICGSLKAKTGTSDIKLIKIDKDIFEHRSVFRVNILVKVVGDYNLPYEKHTIDDYVLRLLMLENIIDGGKIKKYSSGKECVDEFTRLNNTSVRKLILEAQLKNIQEAFENLVKYLKTVFDRT